MIYQSAHNYAWLVDVLLHIYVAEIVMTLLGFTFTFW